MAMYRTDKANEIFGRFGLLDRDDAADIVEAFKGIEEPDPDTADIDGKIAAAVADRDKYWSARFRDAFLTGTIETPGEGAPEKPIPEAAPAPEVLENSAALKYDDLFTEVKESDV